MAGGGGQIQVVQVRGELDLATADSLAARGYAAIGRQARALLLDLAEVSFCDARGLSALVRIANHADRTGCRYGLIAPQPPVVKVLRITGLDQRLPVFTSVNEAAIALGYDTQTALEEPDDQWPTTSQLDGHARHSARNAPAETAQKGAAMTAGYQPGHGWTAVLWRQPARIVDGKPKAATPRGLRSSAATAEMIPAWTTAMSHPGSS